MDALVSQVNAQGNRLTSGRAGEKQILYVRQPGLLAQSLKEQDDPQPLAVSSGKQVRDVCIFALARGIYANQSLTQARRLSPSLRIVPLETVNARPLSHQFFDCLADISPCVEPDGPDAAYVDLAGCKLDFPALKSQLQTLTDFSPLLGLGPSKLAARALAECELPTERLASASVSWLWPEDEKIAARLKRLAPKP